jgi:hypothetical protein
VSGFGTGAGPDQPPEDWGFSGFGTGAGPGHPPEVL